MARVYKRPSIVSGMTVRDILDMDLGEFMRLKKKDLREVTGRLVSAGNKRIRAMEKAGYSTPAIEQVMRSGGLFSTKNKTLNQLRAEFSRARDFMKAETSTQKGYKAFRERVSTGLNKIGGVDIRGDVIKSVKERLKREGITVKDIGRGEYNRIVDLEFNEQFTKIWRAYNRLKEMAPEVSDRQFKYLVIDQLTQYTTANQDKSPEELSMELYGRLDDIYKREKERIGSHGGPGGSVSDFFELE